MPDIDNTGVAAAGAGGLVTGLICGALIGVAVGLLFAPKAGSALRQDLADSAGRLRRKANEAYGTAKDTVNDVVSRGKNAFGQATDAARSTMNAAVNQTRPSDLS